MKDFVVALGLAVAMEGFFYAAVPKAVKRYLKSVAGLDESRLRYAGLAGMAIGVAIVWLVRGT
ncbi:hypothetical protein HDIA_2872 [Hartmannibacter diazotrophicus]|uniref:DUF2065 domain-containing protein n=1 Tax=Hartmannibacter diazotrophicus TaxID=1482074 RepID=A0A2C9D834_9HYPH|nr:DUF2065 domain-containing protein [Hartmannibacter diazotrophicus]SON56413.1 hypothetical protein HDIA_2872 [Hartmannibacter diazotrophicus]